MPINSTSNAEHHSVIVKHDLKVRRVLAHYDENISYNFWSCLWSTCIPEFACL